MPHHRSGVSGQVSFEGYQTGTIHIECFAAATSGNPTVLGTDRLKGPGAFSLDVRGEEEVVLRVYLDENDNGPDQADRPIDLTATVITVSEPGSTELVVNLDARTVTTGG